MEKNLRSIGIHDGAFHADEITACGLLILFGLADADKIVRTRSQDRLAKCEFVCDVGGIYDPAKKLFDHHQASYQGQLSSAGMILLYLYDSKVISKDEFTYFNHSLIQGVDAHDNGRSPQDPGYCSFSHVIANFNPTAYESSAEEIEKGFWDALNFTVGHLKRLHSRFLYNLECRKIVKAEMEKEKVCLFFDHPISWLESFFSLNGEQNPALFVIMPAGEHWKLRGIPPDFAHRMEVRVPLPEKWAGLLGEELKAASGITGAVFCHKGRFTSVWETQEDAIHALKKVLKMHGIRDENAI